MFGSYLNTCDVELFIGWNDFAIQLAKKIRCKFLVILKKKGKEVNLD